MNKFAILILLCAVYVVTVSAQTTEFTYQGSLKNSSAPANGNYDFEFKLFDLVSGGTQQGSTIQRLNVAVANGIFTVSLDFGAGTLPGADRFLDIAVRTAGGGVFTALSPRQKVDSAPYSVKSLNSTTADVATNATQLGGVAADQYVVTTDPRMTDSRMPTAGSGSYIQNGTSPQASSNFSISGTGTANIFNASTQFNIGGSRILSSPAGSFNLFAGFQTGQAITTGLQNSFFGGTAGQNTTTGGNNAFFGTSAGVNNTTGQFNSFFGSSAGVSSNTASFNSFFGFSVGQSNSTGTNNAFFGGFAGQSNTTGSNNSFFGRNAGLSSTIGNRNTMIGNSADVSANNLVNATAVGANAFVSQSNSLILGSINGVNSATADTNVGIGTTSPAERLHVVGNGLFTGNLTVSGSLTATLPTGSASYIQNTTSPQASSSFNITGTGTAVIFNAEQYNIGGNRILSTFGSGNLFAGANAGVANTGSSNAFVGASAGAANLSGSANSFFGASAGSSNTLGSGNAFFGMSAGQANTDGINNAFFGRAAGASNTTGNVNTFFGNNAGDSNTSGGGNAFFGVSAGQANTVGSQNAFFGRAAGFSNEIGFSNTVVGDGADVGLFNLTNATAIGANSLVAQSNSMVLGSINGVNGALADTNVGIGTTAPTNLLTIGPPEATVVAGRVGIFSPTGTNLIMRETTNDVEAIMGVNSSSGVIYGSMTNHNVNIRTNNTNRIVIDTAGNVGVGTSAPNDKLDVNGTIGIATLGAAGSTNLCRNASNQIATCSSSLRYKTNIGQFSQGMSFVNQLRPITFDWKDGGMKDVGFGAEDIAKIDPRFVTSNDKGEVEGVKYDRLSVAFVNAFKEQQTQIAEQQKQIDELKMIVCSLKPEAAVCNRTGK